LIRWHQKVAALVNTTASYNEIKPKRKNIMARPKSPHPTPAELEVLQIIWENGPLTVRGVMELTPISPDDEAESASRAYTTVMSLMNVMTDKGLLSREPQGRAFLYSADVKRDKTLTSMVRDLMGRAFSGSASSLVAHLLEHSDPSAQELQAIRKAIEEHTSDTPPNPNDLQGSQ
jgi:BlaI family penicillinase repressor